MAEQEPPDVHRSLWDPLRKIGSWLRRDDHDGGGEAGEPGEAQAGSGSQQHPHGGLHRRSSRKTVPMLPRPLTFKRMNSEKRDRLLPVPQDADQRRAASRPPPSTRPLTPPPLAGPSLSAPHILSPHAPDHTIGGALDSNIPAGARQVDYSLEPGSSSPPPIVGHPWPPNVGSYSERASQRSFSGIDELRLQEELEARWILNLSMHFRDKSDREKFFITFAEEPTRWRRVTVSCDYRDLVRDSLEADLKNLHYQRDKSARIYEAIRDSLPDIQFYPTVTNLKLQTADGRLNVHVTEDINEIIPYPHVSAVDHLGCKRVKEGVVSFETHISGFVYKVRVNAKAYIKKEIPGPDAVEEFLYEVNALSACQDANSVIQLEAIIVDEQSELIKGLLISYADQGALVDIIYDFKDSAHLSWGRRERWARQIVEGLAEIHEAGFVQGDFTLSNIVVDHDDNAKIIDINRRGCPVGWEPPELARLIESGQRISIYIGVKSDLFQLGMVLWALAEQQDEPERQERPLYRSYESHSSTPQYYRDMVQACLDEQPRRRPAAKDLLARFPDPYLEEPKIVASARASISTHRSAQEHVDPTSAVDLGGILRHGRRRSISSFSDSQRPSIEYIGSSGSYILPNHARGRTAIDSNHSRHVSRDRRSDYSPFNGPHSILSIDDSELDTASLPASRGTRWEQVYVDGDTKVVQRGGIDIDAHEFPAQEPKDVCITTPPSELCSSFKESTMSADTVMRLSTGTDLQPSPTGQQLHPTSTLGTNDSLQKPPSTKASFSERIHHATAADGPSVTHGLADLENEVALDSSFASSAAPSRVGTGLSSISNFRSPMHQDSGFHEPDHSLMSFADGKLGDSLDANKTDLKNVSEEDITEETVWDEQHGTMMVEDARVGEAAVGVSPELDAMCKITTEREELGDKESDGTVTASTLGLPNTAVNTNNAELFPQHEAYAGLHQSRNNECFATKRLSNTTARPPSIMIPEFHHSVPRPAEEARVCGPTVDGNRMGHDDFCKVPMPVDDVSNCAATLDDNHKEQSNLAHVYPHVYQRLSGYVT